MEKDTQKVLKAIGIFLVTCGGTLAASFLYGADLSEEIRNVITAAIGSVILLLLWEDHAQREELLQDNHRQPRRFFVAYLASFLMTMLLPLIVADAWPFVAVYVLLSLLSCPLVGVYAGTMLLMLAVLLQGGAAPEFFMYVFAGFVAVGLFKNLDEEVRAAYPMFIALVMQTVLIVCYHVMFLNQSLSPDMLIVPIINAFLNFVLLIVILNAYTFYVVQRDSERYMEVNDPAFALMLRIREKSEAEYQRAIHTDYLTQRIASTLQMDQRNVRSCSYYHRAAILLEERGIEALTALYREYAIPEGAIRLLQEVNQYKNRAHVSAEATVIMLCDTMIASLQFMFQKNSKMQLDYGQLVDKIFEKKESDGLFENSELSVMGVRITRELLKKETLYYDFLR